MNAAELITRKMEQRATEGKKMRDPRKTCQWCGCNDCAVMDGLCWYHYQEEHYLGR